MSSFVPLADSELKNAEELADHYGSDTAKGLTSKQAQDILERDVPNELEKPPKPTLLMLFIMQLTGFVIILLLVAAVASLVVNGTGPNKSDIYPTPRARPLKSGGDLRKVVEAYSGMGMAYKLQTGYYRQSIKAAWTHMLNSAKNGTMVAAVAVALGAVTVVYTRRRRLS
mmetsp:Transcript_26513/g.67113  ORF Transcript_26513/g.67113 Transcript_26513/m.67113 type:complete len:170 (+) Transcript_26513:94-603(+)